MLKTINQLIFAPSIITGPVLVWCWEGYNNCPYYKNKVKKEKSEKIEPLDK
tara:strand:+ start:509 stop:661 length:153 start_codon:yes stop_codon:yes gene_type:complete